MTVPTAHTNMGAVIQNCGDSAGRVQRRHRVRSGTWLLCFLACLLGIGAIRAQAGPVLRTDDPVGFFTNAAIRLLLKSGYTIGALDSTSNLLASSSGGYAALPALQIPIWPQNFYTPSLHRLLQLAANLYDASTNRMDNGYPTNYPFLPTVLRPVFRCAAAEKEGGNNIWIIGYREVAPADTPALLSSIRPHDLSDPADRLVRPLDMVYNVPLVIGAKKGLPSFDEFTMDTQIQMARKLIYHRPGTSTTAPVNELDVAYYLSITNMLGLQAWNSYSTAYTNPLTLQAWPDVSVLVTNLETGALLSPVGYPSRLPVTPPAPLVISNWPGYIATFPQPSFITPLGPSGAPITNYIFMPSNCVYSFSQQRFLLNGMFDHTPGYTNFHVPHFQATVKSRLRYVLVDTASGRLLDYLNLASSQTVDVTMSVVDGGCGPNYIAAYSRGGMWCTNLPTSYPGGIDPNESFGIRLQIDCSRGTVPNPDWTSSLPDPLYGRDKDKGVNRFLFQFGLGWGQAQPGEPPFQVLNAFAAPFSPFRTIHTITVWQANDPLVHYTVGDLQNLRDFPSPLYLDQALPPIPSTPYGYVNRRYEPWGGNPTGGSLSPTKYDLRVKDPVARRVGSPDDWDFPTDRGTNWLGRVHRGTPWQTIYLKAPGVDVATWTQWTGNNLLVTNYGQLAPDLPQWFYATNMPWGVKPPQVAYDSAFAHPTNDWRLAGMLASLLSANDSRQSLSANQASLTDWLGALDGMVVLTNNEGAMPPDGLASLVMSSNSLQAATIAAAILNARVEAG